jgi:hypothetical protein
MVVSALASSAVGGAATSSKDLRSASTPGSHSPIPATIITADATR